MAMNHGGAGLSCLNRTIGNLFRTTRHMLRLVLRSARAGNGTGDEHFPIDIEWHNAGFRLLIPVAILPCAELDVGQFEHLIRLTVSLVNRPPGVKTGVQTGL